MEELAGVQLTGNIGGDPLFVDLGSNDVRLRSGSPAIGAGAILSEPTTDFFGRPYRRPLSVGAVEVEDTPQVEHYGGEAPSLCLIQ